MFLNPYFCNGALSLCPGYFIATHKLKVNVLDCLKIRKMPPKRLISNPSKSISSTGTIDCAMQTKRLIEKGRGMQNQAKFGGLVDDPNRIEVMTVKELREVMKDVGLPIKGSKHELLSTLRSYLNRNATGSEDPPPAEMLRNKNKSKKMKSPVSSSVGDVYISDTTESKQKRNRSNTQSSTSINLTESVVIEEKLPVESEVAGSKKPRSGKKAALKVEYSGDSVVSEPWTVLTHKKAQPGWVPYNPKIIRPPPLADDTKFMKLMSWNVNGLRALLKSDAFSVLQQKENFDVLCLQETKMQEKDVDAIKKSLFDGYDNSFWTCSITKLGYSGTAIISRIKPVSVSYGLGNEDHDGEGRLVTAEFENFYLLSGYVPNSGDGLRRLSYRINEWDPSLGNYMKDLEKLKPVILTGDLNCAHEEIDIYNPAGNRRSAGFTDEERTSFNKNFLARGFVDTFRKQHPSVVGYTYYGYRHGGRKTNKGWRLDYFLVSESIADQVHDSYIVPEIGGSDHCPIGLILKI